MFERVLFLLTLALAQFPAPPPPAQTAVVKAMIAEVVRTGSLIVRGIEFAVSDESPTEASVPALRDLHTMLLEHDEWRFEVRVHVTPTRDPARDQALSSARARAVVAWLTREGIAGTRLVPADSSRSKALAPPPLVDSAQAQDRVELRKLNEE